MAGSGEESLNGARPAVGVLADRPLDSDRDDRLGYGALADALAALIENPKTDTPLTIALSAPWGAGKISLAKMVENRLKERPEQRGEQQHITCWFNAWMHDDAPHLGSAFAAEIAKEADKHRGIVHRVVNPLPTALLGRDQRIRRIAALTGLSLVLCLIVVVGIYFLTKGLHYPPDANRTEKTDANWIEKIFQAIQARSKTDFLGLIPLVIPPLFSAWTRLSSVAYSVAGFVRDPNRKAATGSMQEVSNQLGKLLQQATGGKGRRFVIFVDDLERCRPPRAVEVCEVAKQLLAHRDVVTVLVADMASVAACADVKYSSLEGRYPIADTRGLGSGILGETYGQEYLQKIVQITFDLPVPPAGSMRRLVNGTPIRGKPHEPGDSSTEDGQAPESAELSQGERLLDVVSRRGWKIALGLLLGVTILAFILDAVKPPPSRLTDVVDTVLAGSIFILLFTFLILALVRVAVRIRARRRAGRDLIRPLSRAEHVLDVVSRRGWKIALGLYLSLTALLAILLNVNESFITDGVALTIFLPSIISFLAILVFIAIRVILTMIALWRRRVARREKKSIDGLIRQSAKDDDSDAGQLADRIKSRPGERNPELANQRAQQYLTDESQLRQRADDELSPFLPRRPRAAKQLMNHLQVVLTVAFIRGMLGGQPEMTVQHLVKWAVLMNRWPELVSTLRAEPEKMAVLEEAPDIGELTHRLRELNYRRTINEDLFFVLHSSAKLSPVMTRLITYETVPDDANVPTTIAADAERKDSARVPEGVGESR